MHEIGPDEVAIEVHATALNRADLLQRAGQYRPLPGVTDVLGLECAGVISAVGAAVRDRVVGERVCALLAGGGYAPQVTCPSAQVWPVDGRSFVEAAALPEALCTVWMVLRDLAEIRAGERLLVHAGASGIGTIAVQVARAWGNPCFVTAGSAEKIARCVALGAEGGAVRHDGPWEPAVHAWAARGVDVIVDPVGYLPADQEVLATDGRIVVIGQMGGRTAPLDLGRLLVKRQRIIGTVLRSRTPSDKARIVAGVRRELWPLVRSGTVVPVIHAVLPVEQADEAHALLASDRTVGKIVLTVRP